MIHSVYHIVCLVMGILETSERGVNPCTYIHTYSYKTVGSDYKVLWEPRERVKFLFGERRM